MKIFDSNFGIHPEVLAIAHMLNAMAGDGESFGAEYDSDNGRYRLACRSFPRYNGRECGIVIEFSPHYFGCHNKALYASFGESRNSDQIFVEIWADEKYYNGPGEQEDASFENAYKNRRLFSARDLVGAVEYIQEECKKFLVEEYRVLEKKF